MDLELRGKVALVTGSSRGIGLATAKAFAAERCRIMLSARSTEQLRETETALRATGVEVAAHAADVGSPDDAARLIEATVATYGGIDILVNNVGGSRNAKVWEMPVADFDFVLRLNLRSTFLCTRAAAVHMMKRRQGRIICMSSGAREGTPWTLLSGRRRLLGRQGRRSRVHSRRGSGARRVQHHGQCHRTGTD